MAPITDTEFLIPLIGVFVGLMALFGGVVYGFIAKPDNNTPFRITFGGSMLCAVSLLYLLACIIIHLI